MDFCGNCLELAVVRLRCMFSHHLATRSACAVFLLLLHQTSYEELKIGVGEVIERA